MKQMWHDPIIEPITSLSEAADFPGLPGDFFKKGSNFT